MCTRPEREQHVGNYPPNTCQLLMTNDGEGCVTTDLCLRDLIRKFFLKFSHPQLGPCLQETECSQQLIIALLQFKHVPLKRMETLLKWRGWIYKCASRQVRFKASTCTINMVCLFAALFHTQPSNSKLIHQLELQLWIVTLLIRLGRRQQSVHIRLLGPKENFLQLSVHVSEVNVCPHWPQPHLQFLHILKATGVQALCGVVVDRGGGGGNHALPQLPVQVGVVML